MVEFNRLKYKIIAWFRTRYPEMARSAAAKIPPLELDVSEIPWTPMKKPLAQCRVAMVTTAGVHIKTDEPFNMVDKNGDPTFRIVPTAAPVDDIMITHDYYDHKNADKDINIVFPIERLREYAAEGRIGSLADRFYGFMGHIVAEHVQTLLNKSGPAVAAMMKEDGVDVALITPG